MKIGGKEISNWWIVGGSAAAVVVWFFYKNASSSSSSTTSESATSSSSIDPVTGLPYSDDDQIDPLTGMTYLQEAEEYGSVSAAESEVSETGATEADEDDYGDVDSGYPTYEGDTSTNDTTAFSTNAAWAQAVTSGLTSLGYSSTSISAALGLYFAGLPLSASDASIVEAAEAEYGPPPQGTYNIIPEPSTSTPAPTPTPAPAPTPVTEVKVPKVEGMRVNPGEAALTAAGLIPDVTSGGPRNPEYEYEIISQTPGAGRSVAKDSKVSLAIKQES